MGVQYQTVMVAQDAMTKPVIDVPVFEVAVLRGVHAQGAVTLVGAPFEVAGEALDAATEYGRLATKYGLEPVRLVYGGLESGALAAALATGVKPVVKAA